MLLPVIASAGVAIDGINYNLDVTEKTASVAAANYSGDIVIPSSVTYENDTYAVTSIEGNAFYGCGLTSISIPNSVTSIGNSAFRSCSSLTSVSIPNSVITIGNSAFSECINLTSVSIPNSVTSIGNSVFSSCIRLISISIPNSITTIGNSAFYNCSGLTSISIPNSVTSIGEGAFTSCNGLTSISIPNSVTSIGDNAFSYCRSLASVSISNSVTTIEKSVFSSCSSLTSVSIPNSVTSIEEYAFYKCSNLASITIPNSVTSIGNSAFRDCYRLTTIYCLNPTPPTCDGISTFESGSQRDKYDVYNYATVHVPMGSGELYSSAYEWRYFNKIKEDMELDGKVYYARLTVKQGTTGYTSQAVKASETYTIYIGSLGENKVNAVTFNGEDVTDEIKNGYYTTPEIKGESELSISYVSETALNSAAMNNTRVTGYDGEIRITNIDSPSDVFVYTVDGQLVGNITSAFGNATMTVSKNQVYLVKIGTCVYKLAM